MSGESRFHDGLTDGLVTTFAVPPAWPRGRAFTDEEGRRLVFEPTPEVERPVVSELRLVIDDMDTALAFYRDVFDLEPIDETTFATGSVPIRLVYGAGRAVRHESYLIVFYTPDIERTRDELTERGLIFKGPRVGYSEIGGTIRFDDPAGNRFCLYVPSEECLAWESGAKVMEIAGRQEGLCLPTLG
jgi:predicted enzyme related to lactoylglutathione lyase